MRIACLQFAPKVGDVEGNLSKADAILHHADPDKLDLLVLPELAFSGYNFKSSEHILPFLEEGNQGVSTLWARSMALKHDCTVIVGYPEKQGPLLERPTEHECYNSAVVMNGDGEVVANYRKTFLYYTDETWAQEGSGFYKGHLPGLGQTVLGICMDINPYKFEAPWTKFEFSQHAVDTGARVVIVSMAWLTNDDPRTFNATPSAPDTDTLFYWVARLEPIIRKESEEEIIVVFANRCGAEGEATYTGTSAVLGIRSGEVFIYGILSRGDEKLLVVDTDAAPYAKIAPHISKVDETIEEENEEDEDKQKGKEEDDGGRQGQKGRRESLPHVASDTADKISPKNNPFPVLPPDSPREQTNPPDMYAPLYHDDEPGYRIGQSDDRSDSPIIQKPMTSSPKSDFSRTRPKTQNDQYMLQRYLELETPNFPLLSSDNLSLGDASHSLTRSKSPNHSLSPKNTWSSLTKNSGKVYESTHDHLNHSFVSMPLRDDDEDSVRSDVSVWNNQPGRVPNIVAPMTRPSAESRQLREQKDYETSR